jgi:hypothetical protein
VILYTGYRFRRVLAFVVARISQVLPGKYNVAGKGPAASSSSTRTEMMSKLDLTSVHTRVLRRISALDRYKRCTLTCRRRASREI